MYLRKSKKASVAGEAEEGVDARQQGLDHGEAL